MTFELIEGNVLHTFNTQLDTGVLNNHMHMQTTLLDSHVPYAPPADPDEVAEDDEFEGLDSEAELDFNDDDWGDDDWEEDEEDEDDLPF